MKKLFTLLFAFCLSFAFSQNKIEDAKKNFQKLKVDFDSIKAVLDEQKNLLSELTEKLDPSATEQLSKTINIKVKLDSIYELQRISKIFYISKNVNKDSLDHYFTPIDYVLIDNEQEVVSSSEEKEIFLLYADDKIIKKSTIDKDSEIGKIFEDIFSIKK